MLEKLKSLFEFSAKSGLNLPTAFDADKQGPSVSLLFANISFYLAICTIIYLTTKDTFAGTMAAMAFAALYFIFYMLRKLNKAKLDLDDRSVELENTEGEEKK